MVSIFFLIVSGYISCDSRNSQERIRGNNFSRCRHNVDHIMLWYLKKMMLVLAMLLALGISSCEAGGARIRSLRNVVGRKGHPEVIKQELEKKKSFRFLKDQV